MPVCKDACSSLMCPPGGALYHRRDAREDRHLQEWTFLTIQPCGWFERQTARKPSSCTHCDYCAQPETVRCSITDCKVFNDRLSNLLCSLTDWLLHARLGCALLVGCAPSRAKGAMK
ncbi:hypothetical protein PBY51_004102 [Eleginops maclovinus]|uniref:Uncharacterized protein n=1 Tax=Eleginops maclovinus TaxID=56733 RepID=A0AAN7Y3N1_ELEMC|nr:hypothetical protein PBY51_004102 [Eleginops maclovinus]